jgi:hypothetical protein
MVERMVGMRKVMRRTHKVPLGIKAVETHRTHG